MFNRVPRQGFSWRLHLLRDIASAAPAHGAASFLSACAPCEGWTKLPHAPAEACETKDNETAFPQPSPEGHPNSSR